jgi:hypothetical protein
MTLRQSLCADRIPSAIFPRRLVYVVHGYYYLFSGCRQGAASVLPLCRIIINYGTSSYNEGTSCNPHHEFKPQSPHDLRNAAAQNCSKFTEVHQNAATRATGSERMSLEQTNPFQSLLVSLTRPRTMRRARSGRARFGGFVIATGTATYSLGTRPRSVRTPISGRGSYSTRSPATSSTQSGTRSTRRRFTTPSTTRSRCDPRQQLCLVL